MKDDVTRGNRLVVFTGAGLTRLLIGALLAFALTLVVQLTQAYAQQPVTVGLKPVGDSGLAGWRP